LSSFRSYFHDPPGTLYLKKMPDGKTPFYEFGEARVVQTLRRLALLIVFDDLRSIKRVRAA